MRRKWQLLLTAALSAAVPAAEAQPLDFATAGLDERELAPVMGGTRRQILERAFAGSGVTVEWVDKKFADEPIEGVADATVETLASRVLARANYVITYDTSGGEPRVIRVLVLGQGLPSAKAAELHRKIAAHRRPQRARPAAAPARAHDTDVQERLREIRDKALARMQASAEAVRQRAQELGGSAPPLRTQAVSRRPLAASAQRGTIPVVPDPRRGR